MERGDGDVTLRWPSQDLVDRSGDFAIIVGLPEAELAAAAFEKQNRLLANFRDAVTQAVLASVQEVLGEGSLQPAPVRVYPIGPAAGVFTTVIVDLWQETQDLQTILSGLADAYAIAEITRRAFARIKQWSRARGARLTPSIILTPYQLTKLCEDHVRRAYHPRAKLSAKWDVTTEEFFGGYRSPAHPTGAVGYLVTVAAGRKTYCYAIDGTGRIETHYVKEGERRTQLPVPDLLSTTEN